MPLTTLKGAGTLLASFLLLTLVACQPADDARPPDATTDDAPVSEPAAVELGERVDASRAVPVADVAASPDRYDGTEVVVEGRITEVCRMKGCWVALDTGSIPVRVTVPRTEEGTYAFTLPTDATGRARVVGTVRLHRMDDAEQRHLQDDGATAQTATELRIAATGVHLLDA